MEKSRHSNMLGINHNGPAVEFVNVALRPEAVTENLVDLLAHSSELDPQPREQSMARFLPVQVQCFLISAQSRYKLLSDRNQIQATEVGK